MIALQKNGNRQFGIDKLFEDMAASYAEYQYEYNLKD
jgi:hypothetical protein